MDAQDWITQRTALRDPIIWDEGPAAAGKPWRLLASPKPTA